MFEKILPSFNEDQPEERRLTKGQLLGMVRRLKGKVREMATQRAEKQHKTVR